MELISKGDVVDAIIGAFQDKETGGLYPTEIWQAIADLPESVVRCRDCRHWDGKACRNSPFRINPDGYCHLGGRAIEDDYCSRGERRTTDDPSHPFADDVMMGERRTDVTLN